MAENTDSASFITQ